jgi:hypothetical protein
MDEVRTGGQNEVGTELRFMRLFGEPSKYFMEDGAVSGEGGQNSRART